MIGHDVLYQCPDDTERKVGSVLEISEYYDGSRYSCIYKIRDRKSRMILYVVDKFVIPRWGLELTMWDAGDMSVGIPSCEYSMKLPFAKDQVDKQERDEIKKHFVKEFEDFFDFEAHGYGTVFEDECPECGKILNGKTCVNKNCYTGDYYLHSL